MNRTLEPRLRRLERRLHRRPFPRVIAGIFDKRADEVVGYEGQRDGTRLTILRQPGEALEALQARAWELVSAPFLATLYSPTGVPQSANLDHPASSPLDPSIELGIPGVGRRATRDELIRMGRIPVPPERLV